MGSFTDTASKVLAFLSLKNTIVFTCVGLVCGGLFVYYQYNERVVDRLVSNQVKLMTELEIKNKIIESNKRDHETIVAKMFEFQKLTSSNQRKLEVIVSTVRRDSRRKRSLEEITSAHPKLIEKKVNNATSNYFEGLESTINSVDSGLLRIN